MITSRTSPVAWRWLDVTGDGTWVAAGVARDGRALLPGVDAPFHPRHIGLRWGPAIPVPDLPASACCPRPRTDGIYWYRDGHALVVAELHDDLVFFCGVAGAAVAAELADTWGPPVEVRASEASRAGTVAALRVAST